MTVRKIRVFVNSVSGGLESTWPAGRLSDHSILRERPAERSLDGAGTTWGHNAAPPGVIESAYLASGSGRTWNFTSLLVTPLPPSE